MYGFIIFEGNGEEIASDQLKQKLTDNIINSLGNIDASQEKAIQEFAQKIVDEYSANILNSEYISIVSQNLENVEKYISQIKKWTVIAIIISIIVLFMLNSRELYKFIRTLGISGFTSGIFLIVVNKFINAKSRRF